MVFDPKRLRYSKEGIPILKAQEIETVATEILQKHCPEALKESRQTPVAEIIKALESVTGLLFAAEDLGYKGRAKILGKISFTKKTLYLDTSVISGEREIQFRFTAAHEIGHWILHRWNHKKWKFAATQPIDDGLEDDEESLCRLGERTPLDWLEWQANVFAASLVMPRTTFQKALIEVQRLIGITRNIGLVWISGANYSQRDFQLIANRLSNVYGVSKQSIRVRLNTFKLLHDEVATSSHSITDILRKKVPPN